MQLALTKEIQNRNSKYILCIFAIILALIAGCRPIGIDNDSINYFNLLNAYYANGKINISLVEPAFWGIAFITKYIFNANYRIAFLIYGFLGVLINVYALKKISSKLWLSVFIYLCLFFIIHEMTQIREGVACGLFLLSIFDLYKGNKKQFIIKILIAASFHYSALIALPLMFLNVNKINKWWYMSLPLLGIIISFIINNELIATLIGISAKTDLYLRQLGRAGNFKLNVFNLYTIGLLVFYYIYIINIEKRKSVYDVLLVKIFGIMLFLYFSLSIIPAFSIRFSEFLGIVLAVALVNIIDLFRERYIASIAVIVFSLSMLGNIILKQNLLKL
jgi:hypothetical protein